MFDRTDEYTTSVYIIKHERSNQCPNHLW